MKQRVQYKGRGLATGIEHEVGDRRCGDEKMEQKKNGVGRTRIGKHDNT